MLGFDANNNKMLSTFEPASQYHAEVCVCKLQNYRYFATQVYINLLYTPLANREEILIDISEIDSKKTKCKPPKVTFRASFSSFSFSIFCHKKQFILVSKLTNIGTQTCPGQSTCHETTIQLWAK